MACAREYAEVYDMRKLLVCGAVGVVSLVVVTTAVHCALLHTGLNGNALVAFAAFAVSTAPWFLVVMPWTTKAAKIRCGFSESRWRK